MGRLNQSALAEQWLADLEAKAKEAEQGEWKAVVKNFYGDVSSDVEVNGGTIACDLCPEDAAFIAAANPAAVLRLLAMVRWLAACFPGVVRPCAGFSRKCYLGDITKCEGDADAECWITAAYAATEDRHDQN